MLEDSKVDSTISLPILPDILDILYSLKTITYIYII